MEGLLIALCCLGILLNFVGRWIMISDTGGDVPLLWILILRFIPFSELVYMVRHFSQAKRGGIISIVGMWLMVPFLGHKLWKAENEVKKQFAQIEQLAEQLEGAEDFKLSPEVLRQMPAEVTSYYHRGRDMRRVEKSRKVEQMNVRLRWWFDQLQQKRAALGTDAAAIERFNVEAAAYKTYKDLTAEAATELASLSR